MDGLGDGMGERVDWVVVCGVCMGVDRVGHVVVFGSRTTAYRVWEGLTLSSIWRMGVSIRGARCMTIIRAPRLGGADGKVIEPSWTWSIVVVLEGLVIMATA